MYVCGITPYDATHLGHAATYVTFDLVGRALRDAGHRVEYVQNVTDVDDPLLERAARDGQDWRELATAEIDLFREDMTALAVLPPDALRRGRRVDGRDHRPRCARCSGPARHTASPSPRVRAAAATSTSTSRRPRPSATSPAGPPSRWMPCSPTAAATPTAWASAAGSTRCCGVPSAPASRPGPTTCWVPAAPAGTSSAPRSRSSTSATRSRSRAAGSDLVFPHHEMSAVQSTALTGDEVFARHYVHQAMVGFEGEKMSKSKGNLVLVSKLRADGVDPMAIRLVLLAQHYRTDWDYTPDLLEAAVARLDRWREALSVNHGRGCRVDGRRGPCRRRRRPRHPGRAGRGRRLGRPHARGGVGRRRRRRDWCHAPSTRSSASASDPRPNFPARCRNLHDRTGNDPLRT